MSLLRLLVLLLHRIELLVMRSGRRLPHLMLMRHVIAPLFLMPLRLLVIMVIPALAVLRLVMMGGWLRERFSFWLLP